MRRRCPWSPCPCPSSSCTLRREFGRCHGIPGRRSRRCPGCLRALRHRASLAKNLTPLETCLGSSSNRPCPLRSCIAHVGRDNAGAFAVGARNAVQHARSAATTAHVIGRSGCTGAHFVTRFQRSIAIASHSGWIDVHRFCSSPGCDMRYNWRSAASASDSLVARRDAIVFRQPDHRLLIFRNAPAGVPAAIAFDGLPVSDDGFAVTSTR